jgi:VWFA-related protein
MRSFPPDTASAARILAGTALLISFLAASPLAYSQDARFTTEVRVVTVLATVRDRQGHLLNNLSKDDFILEEDGRLQTIRYFSQEANSNIDIGLLVDTSRSQQRVFESERLASYTFLDKVLREGQDLAFIMHFDVVVGLLQKPTSSKALLAAALAQLSIPDRVNTLLYDAVRDAATETRNQVGRKALVILSDGNDVGSTNSIATAIEYAQRSDVLIYGILFGPPRRYGHPAVMISRQMVLRAGRRTLQRLATETGGRFFEVSNDHPLTAVYSEIEQELRSQYSIGYLPDTDIGGAGYRRLYLAVKHKELVTQARAGYYAR